MGVLIQVGDYCWRPMRAPVHKDEANEWWSIGVEPDDIPVSIYWHRVRVAEIEYRYAVVEILDEPDRTTRVPLTHLHPIHPLEMLADDECKNFVIESNVPQGVARYLVELRGRISPGTTKDVVLDPTTLKKLRREASKSRFP